MASNNETTCHTRVLNIVFMVLFLWSVKTQKAVFDLSSIFSYNFCKKHKISLVYRSDLIMLCLCQSLFTLDHCIGIIGGRPRHSLYFVGFQGMKAILKGHSQLTHMRITNHFIPNMHITEMR